MPLDPELVSEVRSWLAKSSRDLEGGAFQLTAPAPFTGDAVFHAQQAAEKALKAFLTWHGVPFRKTHSLEELGKACEHIDSTLTPIIDKAVPLTQYAWKFRYPGEPDEPSLAEAKRALATAREVFDAIVARLAEEVRP
jgi:HEPN domain-containing protein